MRQPNCLLHSVTAALVRKFAFGASRGSGWSYFERRNAIGDEKKSVNETVTSGEDIFNTCGKGVGRQMPPKRGGAVAFMRSLPSRRQPFFGSKDDEELNEEAARIHGSGKRALPNEGRGFTEENVPKASLVMQTDGVPEDGRLPGAATVAARPAMLLFGGVYDDGCTSSDTWLWTDKDGWGYRAETGVMQRTALPDPLCDASAAPTKSLVNMVNHLREAHIPSWRTYSMRRLGVARLRADEGEDPDHRRPLPARRARRRARAGVGRSLRRLRRRDVQEGQVGAPERDGRRPKPDGGEGVHGVRAVRPAQAPGAGGRARSGRSRSIRTASARTRRARSSSSPTCGCWSSGGAGGRSRT